jgi:dTDP-3-amino-3,4,6-trideoxy-alpha-D-glucose transaminase
MTGGASRIPMCAMDGADPELLDELLGVVGEVARTGAFIGGREVEAFESEYAAWCEAPHAIGVSSGTDALVLALRALGVGAGDEVVVPANSFVATAEAVSLVGARPRFADVDLDSQLMTVDTLEPALTEAVRCVIPVHLYGRTVEMEPIMALVEQRGVPVIEDCAQAHGARYRGRRVGTFGAIGTFSFYPAKNLGAWGDAGAAITADAKLAERIRLMRSHGESPRYHHRVVGSTARLDAIQAAVLRVKLRRLSQWNRSRRSVADRMRTALSKLDRVVPPAAPAPGTDHVYHQFVVRTPRRDAVKEQLAARGIETGIHYPIAIPNSEAYAALGDGDVAPVAARLADEILSLPVFPSMSAEQIERVATAVREVVEPSDRMQPTPA